MVVDSETLSGSNQSIRYSSYQSLGAFCRRVVDSVNKFLSSEFPSLAVNGEGADLVSQFKTPVELNKVNPQRLLIVGDNSIYESLDQGDTVTEVAVDEGPNGGTFLQDAVAYGGFDGGVPNPDIFYVGIKDGIKIRTAPGGTVTTMDPDSASFDHIRDVVMDADDWNTVFAIDNDQAFLSVNVGTNWADITGNLAAIAGGSFRTIQFLTGSGRLSGLLVGANLGVFHATSDDFTAWSEFGTGLPNAPVWDLQYDTLDDLLVAGTLGRGVWTLAGASSQIPLTEISGTVVNAGSTNRSGIRELQLYFSGAVTVGTTASLKLFNHTIGQSVDLSDTTLSGDGTSSVTWNLQGMPLPDGRQTAELEATVTTPDLSKTHTFEFHKLDGDVNGNGFVSFSDYMAVNANFGSTLDALEFDFGDALDSAGFPTTLASDGARHVITGNNLFLQPARDSEADGQSSADATGNDTTVVDDEGGVSIGMMVSGSTVDATVTASVASSAVINGWIDFNDDGDWDDAGEQVFEDEPISNGVNAGLSISVPSGLTAGNVLGRFRLNETPGYSYTGLVPSGEAEDQMLMITVPAVGTADLVLTGINSGD